MTPVFVNRIATAVPPHQVHDAFRLFAAGQVANERGPVARIPYGFLHRHAAGGAADRLWRVGDQFAVIPSFSGDGVAMALTGGIGAARAIVAGLSAPEFHAAWRRRLVRPMRLAGLTASMLDQAPGALVALAAGLPAAARLVAQHTRVLLPDPDGA